MQNSLNFFEQELQRLAKACDGITRPVFTGRSCYADLDGELRLKLQFVILGCADRYEAVKATVLNRTEGEVDTILLRFSDIWGCKAVSNPNFRQGIIPYIWTDRGNSDWYIYYPTDMDFRRLATEVATYSGVFTSRSTVREQGKQKPRRSGAER